MKKPCRLIALLFVIANACAAGAGTIEGYWQDIAGRTVFQRNVAKGNTYGDWNPRELDPTYPQAKLIRNSGGAFELTDLNYDEREYSVMVLRAEPARVDYMRTTHWSSCRMYHACRLVGEEMLCELQSICTVEGRDVLDWKGEERYIRRAHQSSWGKSMQSQIEKGRWFSQRHKETGALVLPNAWDPGSAVLMAETGFPAIATTSAGMAFVLGLPDGEWIGRNRMLELCAAIVDVVSVPVTADLEAGYGSDPADVAATVRGAIGVGLVGCNIEDGTGSPDRPLFDIALACERIRAGSEAARSSRVPFVLNARTDPYLLRPGRNAENFAEAVKRVNAYREAGADCLYVPGPMDSETIRGLVREIHGPLKRSRRKRRQAEPTHCR